MHYTLHGSPEYPNAVQNMEITEAATAGVPLITVEPDGGGRGWYTNWVAPGAPACRTGRPSTSTS